jgi:hypothetical protein
VLQRPDGASRPPAADEPWPSAAHRLRWAV